MSDLDYGALMDGEEKRLAPNVRAGATDYGGLMDAEMSGQRQRLTASLAAAARTNPEAYSKVMENARALGVPVAAVEDMPEEARQKVLMQHADVLLRNSPVLARQMSSPEFAKLAHDDTAQLTMWEGIKNAWSRGVKTLQQTLPAIDIRSAAADAQLFDTIDAGRKIRPGFTGPDPLGMRFDTTPEMRSTMKGERLQSAGQSATRIAELEGEKRDIPIDPIVQQAQGAKTFSEFWYWFRQKPLDFIASVGAESIPSSAPGMVAAVPAGIAGGPVGVAAALGTNSLISDYASSVMEALQNEGIDLTDKAAIEQAVKNPELMQRVGARAAAHAVGVATFDAISGGIAGKNLAPFVKGKLASGAVNMALQAPVQGTLGALGEAVGSVMAGKDIQAGDVMAEFFGEFAGTPGEVLAASAGKVYGRIRAAEAAAKDAQVLARMGELVKTTKLAERDPQTFADFVQAASEDGPVSTLYMDARELMRTLQQAGLDATMLPEAVRAQVADAVMVGGDVQMPIGDYTARIAGSDIGPALLPHLKTAPEAMSQKEAQVFMQEQLKTFEQEAKRILATPAYDEKTTAGAQAVHQHFMEQLAAANRFTPDVNNAYATLLQQFYTATAQRLGITPQEMLARYPLRVAAENVAGQTVMDQTLYRGALVENAGPGRFMWLTPDRAAAEEYARLNAGGKVFEKKVSGLRLASPEDVRRVAKEAGIHIPEDQSAYSILAPEQFSDANSLFVAIRKNGFDGVWLPNGQDFAPSGRSIESIGLFSALDRAVNQVGEKKFSEMAERHMLHARAKANAEGKTYGEPERQAAMQSAAHEILDPQTFDQAARGQIAFGGDITQSPSVISLLKNADLSTFIHEVGHFTLEVTAHIASQPTAPAQVVEDMNKVLTWFGVKDLATWRAMSADEQRKYHEKFARGFEAYLFEGKAPSVEMAGLFARFRAWLLNVYRSLTAFNVDLTDEVRQVMDRMLAAEEKIREAESFRSYEPIFAGRDQAGMTEQEWQDYQELGASAHETAVTDLERRSLRDMRWASNAKSRALKALQAEGREKRKSIEEEVAAEVRKQPEYAVQRFLKNGELPDGEKVVGAKLSLAALKEMYGEEPAAPWRYLATNMVTTDIGLHPDVVAEMYGFSSGDELVRKILAAGSEAAAVEGLTDQRMLERYGDLVDEKAVERAAEQAVHNEARARFVASELKYVARVLEARQPTKAGGSINILAKAAREFAAQIVARKKMRDIKPSQFAAAEVRAGKAAAEAMGKGISQLVAVEKRNQLVNNYATRAAQDAVDEIEKGVRFLRKFERDGTRKNLDSEYLDQIDQLLERFDLRPATNKEVQKRAALTEWVEEQRALGFEPTIDEALLREANHQHYTTMTLEEFRGLVDAVKNVEHLGRLKKKLLTAKDEREFAAVVDELATSVVNNATGTVKERRTSDRGPLVSIGKLFRNFMADHRKFASLAREMDGWKDAGPMWERLVRTMNDAGNHEAVEREKATVKLGELFAPILKEGKLGKKAYIQAIGKTLTREERMGVALNMGNEVNVERVMSGEKWARAQLNAVLDTLTAEEWKFVQGVWDYLESFRPEIAAKSKRVTGVEPDWVQAQPVVTKHGTFKGGYYPIKYDPLRSSKAEADTAAEVQRQMERGLYVRAQTRRGHLEARVKSTGRPMRYDLGVVTSHVDQVVHDLAWHEWLIDANRLLRASALDGAIRDHYGPEKLRTMRDTLRDIAVGDIGAQTAGDAVLTHMRHGATIVGLGWRLTTALLQPIGLTQSTVRIGAKWVARGAMHWAGDASTFEGSFKKIGEKSDFMRLRAKTMQREINEIRNKVSGKDSKLEASYFYLIQKMQLVADVPTWWGAYEKAMHENGTNEAKAIALADQAVIDAQGSGQIKDLAAVQRGSAAWKLFTNFYSFFNTTYNLTRESVGRTNFKSVKDVGLLAVDMALLYTIPALLGTVLKTTLKGEWDDEEKFVKRLIADQINYMLGTVVVLRELGAVAQAGMGLQGGDYQGPASVRLFVAVAKLAKQAEQGEADEAFWKTLNETAGLVFHYPAGQINATLSGLNALATGETQNPGALVSGAPSH